MDSYSWWFTLMGEGDPLIFLIMIVLLWKSYDHRSRVGICQL